MASIIDSNTVSFLKFDKKNNLLYDSVLNSGINWEINSASEATANSEYYKSRRNSLQTKTALYSSDVYSVYSSFNGLMIKSLKNSEYNLADYDVHLTQVGTTYTKYKINFIYGNMSIDFWFYPEPREGNTKKYCSRTILSIQQGDPIPGSGLSNADHIYSTISSLDIFLSYKDYYYNSSGDYGIRGNLPDGRLGVYSYTYAPEIAHNTTVVNTPNRYKTLIKLGEINEGEWSHFYINRKSPYIKGAVNGIFGPYIPGGGSSTILTNPYISIGCRLNAQTTNYNSPTVENYFKTGIIYSCPSISSSQEKNLTFGKEEESTNVYFDNIRLSNIDLWNANFNPETEAVEMIGKQIFVYDDYAYYVEPTTNEVTKLSFAKWDDISLSDKLVLLDRVVWNDLPDVDQIKTIQTDPSKDIICYNYQTDTIKPSIKIEKIDSSASQIVYPTKFMDYSGLQNYLISIYTSSNTSATSSIRLAVTRDGETYYTYSFVNTAWVPLDNKEDVITDGILASALEDIPKASWIQFDLSKFAFSISLVQGNETDTCQINDITLKVSLEDKWAKANKTTQAKIKYIGPTMMKVTFLEDGKYKINYNDRR